MTAAFSSKPRLPNFRRKKNKTMRLRVISTAVHCATTMDTTVGKQALQTFYAISSGETEDVATADSKLDGQFCCKRHKRPSILRGAAVPTERNAIALAQDPQLMGFVSTIRQVPPLPTSNFAFFTYPTSRLWPMPLARTYSRAPHTYLQSTKSSVEQAPTPPVQPANSSTFLQLSVLAPEPLVFVSCSPYQ